ncbi:phosphohistidine phosphatase SixA [Oceanicoccus sagamiensis]|uniref:Phosphohistidine phosphatase SixA n=1 Tax=Oceanicoccus sagamiensis TaxID=716816 RepID=A0A1X9NF03_9GAMM|nr:phosphohistidine phosphatase SixA [Oceanicoccus sagamiensis]ARN76116.1 phosphohistidine phosphatase SixA [Oceanicoccus sagamiensis]
MNIVILRHGEAEIYADSDAQRNLTDYGREQAQAAGVCLKALALDFKQVWVSPYIRAQQTADGVLSALGDIPRETVDALIPESSPINLVDTLSTYSGGDLLIVSHQPLVSALVGLLENADHRSGPPMSPASMAMLTADTLLAGCCQLQWLRHAPNFEATV